MNTGDDEKKAQMKSGQTSEADPIVSSAIGKQLKQLYDEVAEEPLPDRFAELLKQLEDKDRKGS